jgi:hypothetical protein
MAQRKLARQRCLDEAGRIINGQRDVQYGGPEENFGRIAAMWSMIFGVEVSREDVAMAMVAVKVARYASKSGYQPDTWTDIAGYAACGFEVGETDVNKRKKSRK